MAALYLNKSRGGDSANYSRTLKDFIFGSLFPRNNFLRMFDKAVPNSILRFGSAVCAS
jgi:hypothetical protein